MITIPELTSQALGAFLISETKGRFGSSHASLPELLLTLRSWPWNVSATAMHCITTWSTPCWSRWWGTTS